MSKQKLISTLTLAFLLASTNQLYAGRGGFLHCNKCTYKSDEIYLGGGQGSYSRHYYCPECKEYKSVTYADKYIFNLESDQSDDIENIEKKECHTCGTIMIQVDVNKITKALKGNNHYLPCPKCNKKSLYLNIEFLWD